MQAIQIERALRTSGILLIVGIAGVGGLLTFVGIANYLYSLVPPTSESPSNTRSSTS